ncbi:MAG: GMC family oxidoreductase [Actinomycetota bacterium]|nr:GMC family oxidoreductase [Actinomycetota bacterium]
MTDGERWEAHAGLIDALSRAVVPADDWPSAAETGAADYLRSVLFGDRATDLPAALVALDLLARDGIDDDTLARPEVAWLVTLIAQGYWADPGNHGNRDASSWRSLGYDPVPTGGWLVAGVEHRPSTVTLGAVAERYDVIVIGSGAGGGTAAAVLAESGRRVLIVERGDWPDPIELWSDQLRNPRAGAGFDPLTGPSSAGNPRLFDGLEIPPSDERWSNNAMTAGGGTRVYGAQAWRFAPDDFRMASRYGVPPGSSLADWPIGYDELEPWYTRAERQLGVSGSENGDTAAGRRSEPYPLPPLPPTRSTAVLQRGADALGISTTVVPLLINSRPYGGRSACVRCGACVGFACPVGAKAGSHNTMIQRALATGGAELLLQTAAVRITVDSRGRVDGVELADHTGSRRRIGAEEVVVAAGAVESARLLLASAHDREPGGIGNGTDQVGRHLQAHIYAGALGIFDDEVVDGVGPGPSIATGDYRHGNSGVIGGGMLANEFVPTPVSSYLYLTAAGLIPPHGAESTRLMRRYWSRMQRVVGPIQEVTTDGARVRVDSGRRDRWGLPLVRLSGAPHEEDLRAQEFLSARAAEWLTASGATQVVPAPRRDPAAGPSGGQHQAGTLRMGQDQARSATDPFGRVWGHDNLRVADGSLHVTNAGVNPVLTIFANALRIATDMAR